jgi:hypothetical protein
MSKVRVLFLVSNPLEQNRLALDEESRTIAARIRSADHRDALELISAWAVRPDDLQQLLLQHKPHVVHFSGHGTRAGPDQEIPSGNPASRRDMKRMSGSREDELVLKNEAGLAQPISKLALVHLFEVLNDNIHLVLLSACHSESIAEALAEVVPCTIGMRATVTDAAAITFAAAFYQALGFGRSIREAFDLGKNALMNLEIPEDSAPRLYCRAGAEDAVNVVLVSPSKARRRSRAALSPSPSNEGSSRLRDPENLLHMMWHALDENLQDAFSLAYNKKRRQGGNRISTKDFFQALVRLNDDSVEALIASLPAESLPDPIDTKVTAEQRLVLEERPLLSDCVADSLEHFKELQPLPRRISPVDMFVDIAKHGHGESVSRLRKHGIGKKEIEERVHELGLPVLERKV